MNSYRLPGILAIMLTGTVCCCFAPGPLSAAAPEPPAGKPAPLTSFSALYRPELKPEQFQDPAAAQKLIGDREKLVRTIQETRQRIIRNDRKAAELQKQILALAQELSVIVENNRSMRELNQQLATLDSGLDALERQKNPAATPAAPAPAPAPTAVQPTPAGAPR